MEKERQKVFILLFLCWCNISTLSKDSKRYLTLSLCGMSLRGGYDASGNSFRDKDLPAPETPPYGWDQDRESLKVYILLEGTNLAWGNEWQQHVKVDVGRNSMHVTITDLKGKNFELILNGLYEEISASPACIRLRKDSIYIKLEKVPWFLNLDVQCVELIKW